MDETSNTEPELRRYPAPTNAYEWNPREVPVDDHLGSIFNSDSDQYCEEVETESSADNLSDSEEDTELRTDGL